MGRDRKQLLSQIYTIGPDAVNPMDSPYKQRIAQIKLDVNKVKDLNEWQNMSQIKQIQDLKDIQKQKQILKEDSLRPHVDIDDYQQLGLQNKQLIQHPQRQMKFDLYVDHQGVSKSSQSLVGTLEESSAISKIKQRDLEAIEASNVVSIVGSNIDSLEQEHKVAFSMSESSVVQIQAYKNLQSSTANGKQMYHPSMIPNERISNISSSAISPVSPVQAGHLDRYTAQMVQEQPLGTSKTTARKIESQQFIQDSSNTNKTGSVAGQEQQHMNNINQNRNNRLNKIQNFSELRDLPDINDGYDNTADDYYFSSQPTQGERYREKEIKSQQTFGNSNQTKTSRKKIPQVKEQGNVMSRVQIPSNQQKYRNNTRQTSIDNSLNDIDQSQLFENHLHDYAENIADSTYKNKRDNHARNNSHMSLMNSEVPNLNLSQLSVQLNKGGISYREIESRAFKDAMDSFRANKIDVKENIHELAKMVKNQSTSQYKMMKEQKRIQRSLMEMYPKQFSFESSMYDGSTADVSSMFRSSKDGNKDLKFLKPEKKTFIDFEKMPERVDINKGSSNGCHDNRFNYFDKNKVVGSSRNVSVKTVNFQKQEGRKGDAFTKRDGRREPIPLTEDEQAAMSQQIKFGFSYLNDLPPDNKKFKKRPLMEHSINFEIQTIRDGVELKKDGFIITNKGKAKDMTYVDDEDPQRLLNEAEAGLQEAIRKRKAPDLDIDTAFKKMSKKSYVNFDMGKSKGRYSTGVLPFNCSMPAIQNYSGKKIETAFMNDKSLQMNKFIEQSRDQHFSSTFDKKTQSQISKMRHRQILKNRQNQLMQYFPDEYKDELAQLKEAKLQLKNQSQNSTAYNQKMSKSQSSNINFSSRTNQKKNEQSLQNMDFFGLLQATGFVKKENPKDMEPLTAAQLVKSQGVSGGGGILPTIQVRDGSENRPWRVKKLQKLGENLEVLSDDSDDY